MTLIAFAIPFVIGWLLITYALNVSMLLVGRTVTGVCSGIISLAAPVYIMETSKPSARGFLGSGYQLTVAVGILLSYIVGKYLAWSWLAFHCTIYPVIFLVLMCFMPESPQWLIKRGKFSDATDAMLFLYGNDQALADPTAQSHEENRFHYSEIIQSHILKPFILSLVLMFFQQFSGINAVMFYTVKIFVASGSDIDPHTATIIVGSVQVVFTLVACLLTDKSGRRILLIISGSVMALSFGLMSLYYFLKKENGNEYGWMPILSIITFVAAYSIGYGPLPWVLLGELIPTKVKGSASAISAAFNWLCAFIVTKEFDDILRILNEDGTYLMFGLICFVAVIFVILFLPETKGKSVQEIENIFRNREYDDIN